MAGEGEAVELVWRTALGDRVGARAPRAVRATRTAATARRAERGALVAAKMARPRTRRRARGSTRHAHPPPPPPPAAAAAAVAAAAAAARPGVVVVGGGAAALRRPTALLSPAPALAQEEVIQNVGSLLMAGHETSSNTCCWPSTCSPPTRHAEPGPTSGPSPRPADGRWTCASPAGRHYRDSREQDATWRAEGGALLRGAAGVRPAAGLHLRGVAPLSHRADDRQDPRRRPRGGGGAAAQGHRGGGQQGGRGRDALMLPRAGQVRPQPLPPQRARQARRQHARLAARARGAVPRRARDARSSRTSSATSGSRPSSTTRPSSTPTRPTAPSTGAAPRPRCVRSTRHCPTEGGCYFIKLTVVLVQAWFALFEFLMRTPPASKGMRYETDGLSLDRHMLAVATASA